MATLYLEVEVDDLEQDADVEAIRKAVEATIAERYRYNRVACSVFDFLGGVDE